MPKQNNKISSLEGRKIYDIHLHRWGAQLFSDDQGPIIEISFEVPFLLYDQQNIKNEIIDLKKQGGLLCALIGEIISHIEFKEGSRRTILDFSNGIQLEIPYLDFMDIDRVPALPGDHVFPGKKSK